MHMAFGPRNTGRCINCMNTTVINAAGHCSDCVPRLLEVEDAVKPTGKGKQTPVLVIPGGVTLPYLGQGFSLYQQEKFDNIMVRLEKNNECKNCGRQRAADGGCDSNVCNE